MRKGRFDFMAVFMMAILLTAVPSPAAKKDTLVVAFNDVVATLDHYQSTMRTTIQLGYMVWDSLVTRNPDTGEIIPGLARSWKMVDPLTWEFKLQPRGQIPQRKPLQCPGRSLHHRRTGSGRETKIPPGRQFQMD